MQENDHLEETEEYGRITLCIGKMRYVLNWFTGL
jgi:hypothetical protein